MDIFGDRTRLYWVESLGAKTCPGPAAHSNMKPELAPELINMPTVRMYSMTSFPETPEQITAAWLTNIFRSRGTLKAHQQVKNVMLKPIGEIVGVVGEVARFELAYEPSGAGPASVVIKFAHRNPENRAIANNTKMYEREVRFFNEIAQHIDTPLTMCHFAAMNQDTGANIVVLEDLRAYRVGDQVTGITFEQSQRVVDTLAPLHARFFDRWQTEFDDMLTIASDDYIEPFLPGFLGSWEAAMTNFPACFDNPLGAAMPEYAAGLRPLMKAMGDGPMTFIHGDARMDNAMFGDPSLGQHHVVMIDWQNMMISNPLQDLAWMTTSSLTTASRRAHESDLLAYYHHALSERGVTNFSLADVTERYDLAVLFILNFHLIIAGAFVPTTERARKMAEEGVSRAVQAVLDRQLIDRIVL